MEMAKNDFHILRGNCSFGEGGNVHFYGMAIMAILDKNADYATTV